MKALSIILCLAIVLISCDQKKHKLTEAEIQLEKSSLVFSNMTKNNYDIIKIEYSAKPTRMARAYHFSEHINTLFRKYYDRNDSSYSGQIKAFTILKNELIKLADTSEIFNSLPETFINELRVRNIKSSALMDNNVSLLNYWISCCLLSDIHSSCAIYLNYVGMPEVNCTSVTIPIICKKEYSPIKYELTKLVRNGQAILPPGDFNREVILANCKLDSLKPGNYKAYITPHYLDMGIDGPPATEILETEFIVP